MSVEELIEELKRQPNHRVDVVLRQRDDDSVTYPRIDYVRFNGNQVVLEAE